MESASWTTAGAGAAPALGAPDELDGDIAGPPPLAAIGRSSSGRRAIDMRVGGIAIAAGAGAGVGTGSLRIRVYSAYCVMSTGVVAAGATGRALACAPKPVAITV